MFSGSPSPQKTPQPARLTLRRLLVWAQEPIERLKLMAILCDSVGRLRGGDIASCLNMHLRHGDPSVQAFVSRTLRRVCAPLVDMVHKVSWVEGNESGQPRERERERDRKEERKKREETACFVRPIETSTHQKPHRPTFHEIQIHTHHHKPINLLPRTN